MKPASGGKAENKHIIERVPAEGIFEKNIVF